MSRISLGVAIATAAIAVPAIAASPSAQPATTKAKLQVRSGALGKYLVDGAGRSLYLYAKDTGRKSTCAGTCASTWPPYLTSGKATAGTGVSRSKIGTIKRANGSTQVTYNGHPLYRYAADTAKGQTRGQGIGSVWYLVTPSGKKLVKTTTPTTPPTTTGGLPPY